jgi:hypothetical protein
MPARLGSGDKDQLAPPFVVEMTVAVPSTSLRPPTAAQEIAETHEIAFRAYMPCGSFDTTEGRVEAVTHGADASAEFA